MSLLAILTDTHIGSKGDSLVFDDYFQKFFNEVFFPTIKQLNIKTVFHLGDLVDRRKYINYNILSRFRRKFLHPLEDLGATLSVVPGNHDAFFKNTNEVNAVQELLGGWSNVRIYTDPEEVEVDGTRILLMPWITQANQEVAVAMIQNSTAPYLMGHLEINGFTMHYGVTCETGMEPDVFGHYNAVLTGHFHHKSSKDNIHYLGAPYEMTFADLSDPKGFHLFDTETGALTFVENPYKMFHRIPYDDRGLTLDAVLRPILPLSQFENTIVKVVVNYKSNPYYFEKFIDAIYQVSPAELKIVEDYSCESEESAESGLDAEDTLTILGKYVDGWETEFNRDRLKLILRNLYDQASDMEFA